MENAVGDLKSVAALLLMVAVIAPATSEAKTAKMVSVQTQSGKTVRLRTMTMGGKTMVLVPMDMACDVFHGMAKYC